jgi:4-hydroxysphinganine ceramide fatty acyl 2-hydroxylase
MMASFFRHGSNAVLAGAIVALIVAYATGALAFFWYGALIGAAIFFASEYTTHRFLFHARPSKVGWLLKLQHRLHYDHHIDPPKLDLLFLPLWFTIPVTVMYYAVYLAITRNAALALSLTFGSLIALAYYEWVHYVAHIPFTPVTPFGRWIKKYHLWHHFKNEHMWFGVTNPSMDFVMRTYRSVQDAERSTTVREIWR